MNRNNLSGADIWGSASLGEALRQVADLCRGGLALALDVSKDSSSFSSRKEEVRGRKGVLSVSGSLVDASVIAIRMELARGHGNIRVPLGPLFKRLSCLGDKAKVVPLREDEKGNVSIVVEIHAKAAPMSITRSAAFLSELKRLDELARQLQAELPVPDSDAELDELYKGLTDALAPIKPFRSDEVNYPPHLSQWIGETIDFLLGSASIAIASPFPIVLEFALSVLAQEMRGNGRSLALVKLTINHRGLLELVQKAPGVIAVPATRIGMGSNLYDLGTEVQTLLASLSEINKPVVFTGTLEQLQSTLHGGQGAVNDPLIPVVLRAPDVPFDILARFAVQSVGRVDGGLGQRGEDEITEFVTESLKDLNFAEQKRILPIVARRAIHQWSAGRTNVEVDSFVSRVSCLTETLGGLSARPRAQRKPVVQEMFTKSLTDPMLLDYFREYLSAQNHALDQLVSRLSMEVLTRPLHQPIRYCAQGAPGTGKSESVILLARRLGIPYVNIDTASMPDYHMAATQLLGSGRGFVNSYQAGRLEQVAKHHSGVVLEISDIDHATPSVRSALADLFLQVLETGEAQSAVGTMFSCANIIFAFTMNLPDGVDEAAYKGIGFNNSPSRKDVSRRVMSEIKMMLSGAFLSRIGTPIIFEPLDKQALASVLEQAVRKAIISATERLHIPIREIVLEEGLGSSILVSLNVNVTTFGARAILEHGRTMAAEAMRDIREKGNHLRDKTLLVAATAEGRITIKVD